MDCCSSVAQAIHVHRDGTADPDSDSGRSSCAPPPIFSPTLIFRSSALSGTTQGLSPKEMSDRITSITERALTTLVNDIEHIESQSLNGVAVVKDLLSSPREHSDCVGAGDGDFADCDPLFAAGNNAAAGHSVFGFQRADSADRPEQQDPS